MRQRSKLIRDSADRYKLEVSMSSGRYQLSLDDRAAIFLTDRLGLSVQDTVPEPFIPFFIAMGDAWFPNQRDADKIIQDIQSDGTLDSDERSVFQSYLTESRIPARHEKRVRAVLKDSPITDEITPSDLQIQELPSVPGIFDSSDAENSTIKETKSPQPHPTQDSVGDKVREIVSATDESPSEAPTEKQQQRDTTDRGLRTTIGKTSTQDSSQSDRLIAFGHIGGNGDIVERIAAETDDAEIDGYIYTGSDRVVLGSPTDQHTDEIIDALAELSKQAPVYVVDSAADSVWTDDTDQYAPSSPPTDDFSHDLPENVTQIPVDERIAVGNTYLTRNPWLDGNDTVLVSNQAQPEQWHGEHAAYIAGENFVGRQDHTYLNVGFTSFDPGVGRDTLYGQYVSLTVTESGVTDTDWHTLGAIEEHRCPEHRDYGRFYLLDGLDCPSCAAETRDKTGDRTVTETPTTIYKRPYLIASDNLPTRRAYQTAYFSRYSITQPGEMDVEAFPTPTEDAQAELDARALEQGDLRGEIMYFLDAATADETWVAVQDLVSQGELYDARISTAFTCTARGDSQHLLMVTVPNYADVADSHRVHQQLTDELDLDDPAVVKPTQYTNLGIYTSNASEWGLSRSTRYTVHTDDPPTTGRGLPDHLTVESDHYPTDMKKHDQWLLWKPEPDGRKIPRAPWRTDEDRFVSAMDTANQTTFETAAKHLDEVSDPDYGLAFTLTEDDPFVLIDYDHARDPETGTIAEMVRQHMEDAESYADISTSGTGAHLLVRGELSEDVQAIIADLPDHDLSIEVYEQDRFIVMTGDHVSTTPRRTTEAQGLLDRLQSEHATRTSHSEQDSTKQPVKTRAELLDIGETDSIEDVFDSIKQVRPSDIRLRSTVTNERYDGSKSLDPSWTTSDSGTRLGQLDDIWIYRKGMYALDALQVVALEERLISHPDEYPSGETFWNAVQALRDRGAHIPKYVSSSKTS